MSTCLPRLEPGRSPPPRGRPQPLLYWPAVLAASVLALLLSAGLVVAVALTTPQPAEASDLVPSPVEPPTRIVPPQPAAVVTRPAPQPPPRQVVRVTRTDLPPKPPPVPEATRPPTSLLGTRVEFVDSPAAAARTAAREEKLLYVLHVSGNFEDPGFT